MDLRGAQRTQEFVTIDRRRLRPIRRQRPWVGWLPWILPAFVVTALLIGLPLLYTFWLSLHQWFGSHTTPWTWVGIANYQDAFESAEFRRALFNTLVFATVGVVGSVVAGTVIALLVDGVGRARWLLVALLLVPVVSTPVAVSTTWRYLLQFEGPLNWITSSLGMGRHAWLSEDLVLPTLIIVDMTRWASFVALIVLAGLSTLPTEPLEAAEIDGASTFQRVRYVVLPLLMPFIGVAAIFRLIDAVKTFDEIQVISSGGPAGASQTLYVLAYKNAFSFLSFGTSAAISVLMLGIALAGSLLVARSRGGSS